MTSLSGAQATAQSTAPSTTAPSASGAVTTASSYVCPKCGRIHATPQATTTTTTSAPKAAAATPVRSVAQVAYQKASGGVQNVLSMLNNQRSRQGLRTLRYDATLQSVAERRAQQMASMGLKSHPPGSFAPGRYEGVGWSSSFSPRGVSACYTSDPRMTAAGAAMVTGRDGVYFAVVYR
ncbi:Cysteine-rich secretory protein family protein [Stieleria neptunia]|uniref:Cysteine-rich secretory protein family protein n=2 Tax=Stieleria neptunia TaxID=2527979 RepID=A0A518HZB1_9BACT|nr:Cysteine-rich secretory protein family protein [Stieleria neptunia]